MLLVRSLQLDFMRLTTTLWAQPFQPVLNPPHCLLIQPIIEQYQKPYWSPGRKYPLLSSHISWQPFQHTRLSSWSNMTSLWWSHADYSLITFLSFRRQEIIFRMVPSPSKGSQWVRAASSCLSLSSLLGGWSDICFSPAFGKFLQSPWLTEDHWEWPHNSQWQLLASSALEAVSHQAPWTYVCLVCISAPRPDPLPPRVAFFLLQPFLWSLWPGILGGCCC